MSKSLLKEVRLPHPPEAVWVALTDPNALAEWLMPNNFEPRVGQTFRFRGSRWTWKSARGCSESSDGGPCEILLRWRVVLSYHLHSGPNDRGPMRRVTALAFFTAVAACGGNGPLGPDFVEELDRFGGCGDMVFYAVDGDDELILRFVADGLLGEAQSTAGGEATTTYTFPIAAAELVLEQGTNISQTTCNDVITDGGPQISRSWTAVSGTATVSVRSESEGGTARADLLLEAVVLDGDGGDRVTLDQLEWSDVHVGWYPG